jgi:hypothetical protein
LRLADECNAAQERGEVASNGQRGKAVPEENSFFPATAEEIGLSRKDIHEARRLPQERQGGADCLKNCVHHDQRQLVSSRSCFDLANCFCAEGTARALANGLEISVVGQFE